MWFGEDDRMQGFGSGSDGNLYQWVQGVDGLGNAVGCWRRVRGQAQMAPYARRTAPFLGDVAAGPDGQTYQWVQGVDGLGNPFGFWKRIRKFAKRALPFVQKIAPFIPGGAAALTAATPFLRQVGIEGPDGLGALYEAPDGSMYQVQGIDAGDDLDGLADDDELRGLSEEELQGLAAEDELNGFGAEEELNGFGAEDELNGFAADEELQGFGADDDLSGLADEELQGMGDEDTMSGYVRDTRMNGMEGFAPAEPRRTPEFSPSQNAPMWTPIW
jgi:hypothetical protein